jgi:methyl-galactoside transport system substrate-binding protein
VGTDADAAGKMQGDVIKQLWNGRPEYDRNADGIFQYVMFQGNPDNPEALARTEYSVRQAREHGVEMRQIGETHVCNWDANLAKDAMLLAFASHGENIELVISNNDAMALGAISALASFGYNTEGESGKFIPIVGVDAVPQAVEAITKGIMSATVKQDSAAMAKAVAALTRNAVEGKNFLDETPYTWDASGIAIRIPYSVFPEKTF